MEHYKKQASIAWDLWQLAMDAGNTKESSKYMIEYNSHLQLIKQAEG